MLENIQEIKEFIKWAKENKVKSFKSGGISFEISEIAMIPNENLNPSANSELNNVTGTTLADSDPEEGKIDEETLFWSST